MSTGDSGLCPVLATPQNGIITADNANSLAVSTYDRTPGTQVTITCYWDEVYTVQGNDQVTCVGGQWVPDPPVCVRKDGASPGGADNANTNTSTPSPPSSSDSDTDLSTTALILVSVACAVVVIVLVLVLIYRICCLDRAKSKYKHVREDYSDGSVLSSQSFIRLGSKAQATPFSLTHAGYFRSASDPDPFTAPPSLWSVPPSQRYVNNYNNYHYHHRHLYEQHPRPPARGSAPLSIQATFRGLSTSREWTYLSVDRLLRDIEASRKNNPNHSWRDFASLSTDVTAKAKKSRKS